MGQLANEFIFMSLLPHMVLCEAQSLHSKTMMGQSTVLKEEIYGYYGRTSCAM